MNEHPQYLTTKEVADLLRVKERKVYDLAAADEIPHRRITGKLLFPAHEISAWIEGGAEGGALQDRPLVLTGSHDPLLDWAVREAGAELATFWNGSFDGLDTYAARRAALAVLHIPESGGWNVRTVAGKGFTDCVLLGIATRARGLLLTPGLGKEVTEVAHLRGKRLVRRQPGAGAAALLARILEEAGLSDEAFAPVTGLARTETDAATMVSTGEADAALGIGAMARQFHLDFLPLMEEHVDLLVDRKSYFSEPVQTLFTFLRSEAFAAKAAAMGGYDIAQGGSVRWVSP